MEKRWRQLSLDPSFEQPADQARPEAVPEGYFSLHMRRYLGCKTRLLPRIAEVVGNHCPDLVRFFDVFAGTGVVADLFNTPDRCVVVNDFLASNHVVLTAWFTATAQDRQDIEATILHLRGIRSREPNYYSENYGGRFFTVDTAATIGHVRDAIDRMDLRPAVKCAAIASVLYGADASALTCGHFDAYRGLKDRPRPFMLRFPAIPYEANGNNEVRCADGNHLVGRIETDLLYIDPPYNRRQYGTLYHVLDNIAANRKPPLTGKTKKIPLKDRPVSRYSTARAAEAMRELITGCRARHLLLSYNNMASGGQNSNALISLPELEGILAQRGSVATYRIPFPSFTARRKLLAGHEEYLLYCRVTKLRS